MDEPANALNVDRWEFRDVVRHPQAHAFVLGRYRIGEYAGVVALQRLLNELQPGEKLGRAMQRHFQDEQRHSEVFTEWMERLGTAPDPLSADSVEGFFFGSPEALQQQRALMAQMPAELRRIIVFAGINAIERLAFNQFENHLLALDRPGDVDILKGVMKEEKFHLNYVEQELERQQSGPHGEFLANALQFARLRFDAFQQMQQTSVRTEIENLLGGSPRD